MRSLLLTLLFMVGVAPLWAQTAPTSSQAPASTRQMVLPSHGNRLLGVFYLAAGSGPHPTAIIFHGFPGFEQNLDLAQALRAGGWNVLAMHYRGSWGVKGDFSFQHAAEDADTQVGFLMDASNAAKYRIDRHRIVVIGHSMGGYMAASAAAHNPQVAAAVLISAWNIGADYDTLRNTSNRAPTLEDEARALAEDDNLMPLSGTSGEALACEIQQHRAVLNLNNLSSAIAPRPVLVTIASDGNGEANHAFAEALRKAGDTRVAEKNFETDHSYSAARTDLIGAVSEWLRTNVIAGTGPTAGALNFSTVGVH